jgi:hypothetical protein
MAMATDEDKDSAWIRFEAETTIRAIRRPRLDRDGLFLFGRRHAAQLLILDQPILERLAEGKTIAVDVQGQYILYVQASAGSSFVASSLIDQTDSNGHEDQPTHEEQVIAAQIRLKIDRKDRKKTPEWIQRLAAEGDS